MQVVPGFFVAERTRGGRAYLVADASGGVLVDTGTPDGGLGVGALLADAGIAPAEVRLVLLTHAHPGHAGSAAAIRALTGAPVAASAGAAGELADPPVPRRSLLRRLLGDLPMAPFAVDRVLQPGEVVDLGGGIRVIDAPGHGGGSLAYHLLGPDVLCVGDAAAVTAAGVVAPPRQRCADPDAAAETAARLAGIAARVVAPGHGFASVEGRLPRRVT